MPRIVVLPHRDCCPAGEVIQARPGQGSLAELLLAAGVDLPHSCELNCACTTCHVLIRDGVVAPPLAQELSITQNAMGFGPSSRLACQVQLGDSDLVVEIP